MRPFDPNTRPGALALPHEIRVGLDLRYVLYRFFDAEPRLLYVGITTGNPRHRWRGHQRKATWWPDVAFVSIEHLLTWQAARAAERTAIRSEDPLHNIADRVDERPTGEPITEPARGDEPAHDDAGTGTATREIPITQARMALCNLVDHVADGGPPIAFTRRNKIMAGLVSIEDVELLMTHGPEETRRRLRKAFGPT